MAIERICPLESEGLNFIKALVNIETSGGIYISLRPLDISHKSFEMTGWVSSMLLSQISSKELKHSQGTCL